MADINCAALVYIEDEKLLLVKVRELEKYYLPGGKIEAGERPIDAAIREAYEELNVVLDESLVRYVGRVEGPAYPQDAVVSLECFTYDGKLSDISKNNEITEVRYFDLRHHEQIAPAVLVLIEQMKNGVLSYAK